MTSQKSCRVSCIIPAFNEEKNLANVLRKATKHPLIDEVIVVDDGSTDKTREIAETFHVNLVSYKKNLGKAMAIKTGVENSRHDILVFLDADLQNLSKKDIKNLIEPVLKGKCDVTIGLKANLTSPFRLMGIDFIGGDRAVRREIMEKMPAYENSRFGFEVLMNQMIIDQKISFMAVPFVSTKHVYKSEKHGFVNGIKSDIKMFREIADAMPPGKIVAQMANMVYQNNVHRKNSKLL